ncbi:hypothetical protein RHSIM_Rhsim05G0021100 [Rhododendron simsii]|uniref:Ubiquitin-like protease family profile domain-containing protein n=1 Tax=Rhododendron simsii TaxID=118357 RepID=A0A834GZ03_RHOSS|nr:hypothetical protein RHSIM_Rhsim05G0021100 [Rhododendron simsii]
MGFSESNSMAMIVSSRSASPAIIGDEVSPCYAPSKVMKGFGGGLAESRDVLGDVGVGGWEAVWDGFVAEVQQAVKGVGTSGLEQTSVVVLCVHKGYVEAFVVAVIWSSEADMLHIEVEDIQNLLFEDATSNRDTIRNRDKDKVKAMLGKVMKKSVGARFLLFPILVRFHWTLLVLDKDEGYWKFYNSLKPRSGKDEHCSATLLLRQVVAAYVNIDQREPCKRNITDKVEIQKNSPEQPVGRKVLSITFYPKKLQLLLIDNVSSESY